MSDKRLARSVGGALAAAGVAALVTGGIALAQGGQHQPKSPPPGSGPVSVSGHTAHVISSGGKATAGSGAATKSAPPGSGPASVSGHTAHVAPAGATSTGSN